MATYTVKMVNESIGFKKVVKAGLTKEEAIQLRDDSNKGIKENGIEGFEFKVAIQMNEHEKVIDRIIRNCVSEWIGGYENTMTDYPEGSEEYEAAKAMLNHDRLFDAFYADIMLETKRNAKSHVRFAGKQFIEDRIETALKKNGYGK